MVFLGLLVLAGVVVAILWATGVFDKNETGGGGSVTVSPAPAPGPGPAPAPPAEETKDEGGWKPEGIAAVSAGGFGAFILLIAIIYYFFNTRRMRPDAPDNTLAPFPAEGDEDYEANQSAATIGGPLRSSSRELVGAAEARERGLVDTLGKDVAQVQESAGGFVSRMKEGGKRLYNRVVRRRNDRDRPRGGTVYSADSEEARTT